MRCGWLLAWVCLCLASGGAQTILKASPLLDDDAATYRAVFKVELERRGSNTRGTLALHDPVRGALLYSLDLAANARKQLYVSVSLGDGSSRRYSRALLEWRSADGEHITTPLYPPLQTHLPIVVVGDMIGGLEMLNERRVTFPSAAIRSGGFEVPLRVYYRRPAALPDVWQALLELPIIVLVEGAETLSESQWHALRRWLASGGSLVVAVGSLGATLKATPLAQLLPPIPLADRAATLAPLPSEAGWQILMTDKAQRPILYSKRVGLGQLYLFMGALEQPRWRNRAELPEIFNRVIQDSEGFPSERLSEQFDDWLNEHTLQARYTGNRWGVLVLPLYLLGVWGLTVSLRRRRRLSSGFAPLTVLATIGAVAALVFAPRPSRAEPTLLSQTFLNETGVAIEVNYLYATLGAGRHTLALGADTETLNLFAKPNATVQTHFSSETPTLQIHCASHTHLGVCMLRPVADAPALKAYKQGNVLQVRNLSPERLVGVQIYSSDASERSPTILWRQGVLNAGAQKSIPIAPQHKVWIEAFYTRTGAPVATLNGKPIREVNVLYFYIP
ncbi:MAG: hypothetical protein ACK4ME_05760 [Fimbriimonadales bacterium]